MHFKSYKMRTIVIIFFITITLAGCGRGTETTDHGHDHPPGAGQQLTLFSDSSEFFIDHEVLMAGHKALLLVHATRLSTYKPYKEGRLRVTLENNTDKISAESTAPEDPGIWKILLRPSLPGEYIVRIEFTEKGLPETASGIKCIVHEHEHEEEAGGDPETGGHSHQAEDEDPAEGIVFTKEQAWNTDFAVIRVDPVSFASVIKTGGEILPLPDEKYFIHARTPGIVNFTKKHLVAGGDIRKGEEMLRIEGQDLADENISVAFAESKSRFEKSRDEYTRHLHLFRVNALSEKQFIESRSEYFRDSIQYFNLRQSYKDGGLSITAPISGHIHELLVSQGQYVEKGRLIATISSDDHLLLRADVPQRYFGRLGDISTANIRTSYQDRVISLEDLDGKLLAIGSSVKENNQYLPVYFEASNNGELLEGAFAEFYLLSRDFEECLAVPVEAVTEEQGRYFVYVQLEGELYRKREVRIAGSDGFRYRLTEGLTPGERIVSRGNILLKAASMSNTLPGHSHSH